VRPSKNYYWQPIGSRIIYDSFILIQIDFLYYKKSIGSKMNEFDLCLEVVSRSSQPLRYILTLNILETVMDRCLLPKDRQ